jgi:transposase InsO family protein
VITDYFSRWVEAVALKNKIALTTAQCVFETIVERHGMPKTIVSERGTNFTSSLFRYFCTKLQMKPKFTTAYHQASNGETERFNRTLMTMLRKELVDGAHSNWQELIDPLLFAYRSSIHSSTKESPYYIVHGRDPNIPINEFLSGAPQTDKSPSDYVGGLVNRLLLLFFQRVAEESDKARERQRQQYNKRAKEFNYKVIARVNHTRVLLDIRVLKTGYSGKFT